MGPGEARDLMFAGAGILWGAVTVFRGVRSWNFQKAKFPSPAIIVGAGLAITCIGYLFHRL